MVIIAGVLGGVLLAALPTAALKLLGFTGAGVAAGSIAAFFQSVIGNVAAGSIFAVLQSIGATGISAMVTGSLGVIGSVIGGALSIFF